MPGPKRKPPKSHRRDRVAGGEENSGGPYMPLVLSLPRFLVAIIEERAQEGHVSSSGVVETLLLETIRIGEVESLARRSPAVAAAVEEWLRFLSGGGE